MKYFLGILCLLLPMILVAQNNDLERRFVDEILNLDFKSAHAIATEIDEDFNSPYFESLNTLIRNHGQEPDSDKQLISLLNKNAENSILNDFITGVYYLYNDSSNHNAFIYLRKSIGHFEKRNRRALNLLAHYLILELYSREMVQSHDEYFTFINKYNELSRGPTEKAWLEIHRIQFYSKSVEPNSLEIFKNKFHHFEDFYKEHRDKLSLGVIAYFQYFTALNHNFNGNYVEAKKAYIRTIEIGQGKDYLKYLVYGSFIHLIQLESTNGNMIDSKRYLDSSKNYWDNSDSIKSQFIDNRFSAIYYYERIGDSSKAYNHLKRSIVDEVALDHRNNTLKITETNIKLKTVEKENQLLVEQQSKQRITNIAIVLGVLIIFIGVTASLLHQNTNKKRLLAEQQKKLQIQKLDTVLKEQELVSIDAMIEGQEKERQRIANELHDDLGSLMANVKLHFNALQEKNTPELLNKTDLLIDEAYQKIRTVAHAKNSGVMVKQGLYKAVETMAAKISSLNKIKIEVVGHGLDERLENSLELTIFRIIQELTANVIKHAEATEAIIHLTQHEKILNLMVEDNGKGFKTAHIIAQSDSMGLRTIDKRIEHLNGELTIESEPGQGTTIIIDIPI